MVLLLGMPLGHFLITLNGRRLHGNPCTYSNHNCDYHVVVIKTEEMGWLYEVGVGLKGESCNSFYTHAFSVPGAEDPTVNKTCTNESDCRKMPVEIGSSFPQQINSPLWGIFSMV